jgi:hypothetical protein
VKTTLDRNSFRQEMRGKSIDVQDGQKTDLKELDLQKADLNGDGKVSGAQETRKLFESMDARNMQDGFDTGDARTLLTSVDGRQAPAAALLEIARDLAAESLLPPPMTEAEKSKNLMGNVAKGMFALGLGALVAMPLIGLAPASLLILGSQALKLKSEL